MNCLKTFLFLLTLLIVSCSDSFEQEFDNYTEFSQANLRQKSWFPDLISKDAYSIKSESSLAPLCDFGTYKYTNNKYYDSVFSIDNHQRVDFSTFMQKVKEHADGKPNWFLNIDLEKQSLESIKVDRFYIARQKENRQIYFILSN